MIIFIIVLSMSMISGWDAWVSSFVCVCVLHDI